MPPLAIFAQAPSLELSDDSGGLAVFSDFDKSNMLDRSIQFEVIRRHASIEMVEFRQLPGGLEDRRVPLPLPVLDVK